jgi:hypothetical protein
MDSKGDVRSSRAPDADDHVVEQRIMGESHTSDSAGFELFGLLWGAMVGGAEGYRAFGWVGGIGLGYLGVVISQICSRLPRLRQYEVYTLFAAFESWGLMLGVMLGLFLSHAPWVRPNWPARIGLIISWGVAGWFCGWVPSFIITFCRRRTLSRETTDALKARLRNGTSTWYQLVMGELQKRGADLRCELPLALTLLSADRSQQRLRGWQMLRVFFPHLARKIPDYDPSQTAAKCRANAARISSETA